MPSRCRTAAELFELEPWIFHNHLWSRKTWYNESGFASSTSTSARTLGRAHYAPTGPMPKLQRSIMLVQFQDAPSLPSKIIHTHTQRDITHHIFSSCNERVPSLGFLQQLLGTAQPSCQGVHSHGPHGQEWTPFFWSWNFQGPRRQISEDWQRHTMASQPSLSNQLNLHISAFITRIIWGSFCVPWSLGSFERSKMNCIESAKNAPVTVVKHFRLVLQPVASSPQKFQSFLHLVPVQQPRGTRVA